MKRWLIRILAVAQIGGGFFGVMLVIQQFSAKDQNTVSTIINLAFAALFVFGVIAGIALFEAPTAGVALSRFYWVLQIPIFSSPFFEYGFASGLFGTIRFGTSSFNWNFAMGSRYIFFINGDAPWTFGLNLVAIFFFVCLLTIKTGRQTQAKLSPEQLHEHDAIDSPVRQSRKNEFLYAGAGASESKD